MGRDTLPGGVLLVGAILLAVFVLPSPWSYVAVVAAAGVEVLEVWFWLWYTRRRRPAVGVETLVGRVGEVVTTCRPRGQVRVDGELWAARCDAGADPGDPVRVAAVERLTLLVEPEPRQSRPSALRGPSSSSASASAASTS
jgi:membrane-bound serine protease (ClpP class)